MTAMDRIRWGQNLLAKLTAKKNIAIEGNTHARNMPTNVKRKKIKWTLRGSEAFGKKEQKGEG